MKSFSNKFCFTIINLEILIQLRSIMLKAILMIIKQGYILHRIPKPTQRNSDKHHHKEPFLKI
jgi:hypothetical protein